MLIIGEKLNSSIPNTLTALSESNEEYIVKLIKDQESNGAQYLDINTAMTNADEIEKMKWVINLVKHNSECNIVLDSPNETIFEQVIEETVGRNVIINSISCDQNFDALVSVVKKYDTGIVCMPIKDKMIPSFSEQRIANSSFLVDKLLESGVKAEKIYVDVLIEALATASHACIEALNTIKGIKEKYPKVNTVCGLSNVSFGLPNRAMLNATFLSMALAAGLDSAIIDVTSKAMKNAIFSANALLGKDDYCMNFIQYYREQMQK